ncbi:hypothetical protein BpHYR1_001434 [Brachionus plicatilis]|uniref:Uncharacterized protein n=1 Tax=Brachionus plicatilis TaxID=10195 RepID=A0A3M7PVP6_BRAPC|nr:hypothetical protein BpHYR1_001434 [Brachionus plicatilis]
MVSEQRTRFFCHTKFSPVAEISCNEQTPFQLKRKKSTQLPSDMRGKTQPRSHVRIWKICTSSLSRHPEIKMRANFVTIKKSFEKPTPM